MRELNVERSCPSSSRRTAAGQRVEHRSESSHNAYSVPSRLIGESCVVHASTRTGSSFDTSSEKLELAIASVCAGAICHRIDYRHVIWSLDPEARWLRAVRLP
jgi:hypothetical protein